MLDDGLPPLPSALETARRRRSVVDAARARARRLERAPGAPLSELEREALEWAGELGRHYDMEAT